MLTSGEVLQKEQVISGGSTARKINKLLNSPKTRLEGLELLNTFLPHCPDEDFLQFCVNWMQNCCKADGVTKNRNYSARLLSNLFEVSSNYQELKKSVSFFITTRYFDYFFKYFIDSQVGWTCTKTCLLFYKGACGPFQASLENHLMTQIEKNCRTSPIIASCFALLPCVGGGGKNGKNYNKNWKDQFGKFLNVCHSILNDLFADVEELQEYDTVEHTYKKKGNERNVEYLATQFYNYSTILCNMLVNKFPAPKTVPSDLIFELICRGLAVNPKALANRQTTEIMSLQKLLPEIHCSLLSLLKAVVVTCKNQLLPYSHLICKLIKQSLEWTECENSYGSEKPFGCLRISVYESLCNWLAVARNGSCVETISSIVISSAVSDIKPKKGIVLLKDIGTQKESKNGEQTTRQINTTANSKLCYTALITLQYLLKFTGISLKQEAHKYLQEVVVKILIEVQKSSLEDSAIPFAVSACRTELYSLLLELVHQPNLKWPPPTNFALRLFTRGVNDSAPEVSAFCSAALNLTTIIIHPQYDNGGFPSFGGANDGSRAAFQEREEPMEVEEIEKEGEGEIPVEKTLENSPKSDSTDPAEKISDVDRNPEVSSDEDSTSTIKFPKYTPKVAAITVSSDEVEIAEDFSTPESQPTEQTSTEQTKTPTEGTPVLQESQAQEPIVKQPRLSEELTPKKGSPVKTPENPLVHEATENTTPVKPSGHAEDPECPKASTPESTNDESHTNRRYFLRSQTKASSEEPEESGRKTNSPDVLRWTPCKSVKTTPVAQSARKRRRTRNLSKVEEDSEKEGKTSQENCNEDEDIKAAFDDSFLD